MVGSIQRRLAELGVSLPQAMAPANYACPTDWRADIISGQVTSVDGKDQFTAKLGEEYEIESSQAAARWCAINILAKLSAALDGDLDRVVGVVRLGGFINTNPDFTAHPAVLNGASDLTVEIFGEAGRHARAAVGVYSLPRDAPVEVDGIFEVS